MLPKIYLSARIANQANEYILQLINALRKQGYFVVVPWEVVKDGDVENVLEAHLAANIFLDAIKSCDYMICAGSIGIDCASEIGYAAGLNKPILRWIWEKCGEDSWMVDIHINEYFVGNEGIDCLISWLENVDKTAGENM